MQKNLIQINYIEFNVINIEQSKAFYGEVFGWKFTDYGPDYCEFNDGKMTGGFTTQDAVQLGGPMVVLYSEELEPLIDKIKAAGGTIVKDIFQFPGGERFEFSDPTGHILAIWRRI